MSANSKIADAVTAVVTVGDEILMLHRNPALHAFAGFEAFPGGQVDPDDERPSVLALPAGGDILPAHVNAMARELREETGCDLPSLADSGELEEFSEIGYALTPAFVRRRFSAWFYRIRLSRKPTLQVDAAEHTGTGWASAADWLQRYEQGALLLAPPTRFALQELAANPHVRALGRLDSIARAPKGLTLSEITVVRGVTIIMVRSNTLPPAQYTNCFLIGNGGPGAPRLLVDPSPCDDAELERLATQTAGRFDAIFITHHHPDHHERADKLARRCRVPVWLSADTHRRIAGFHPRFFEGLSVRELADGEVVTRWLDHPVRVLAVPGHDAGQLALIPDNRAWCLVGDLIQGIGTVVIQAPEGDMARYFATLEKVIALRPRVIFPSHGFPLGGTHYLQAALDHRRLRERQILELSRDGADEDEILTRIYATTPPPLLPYARLNIRSHLAKLRAEHALA
ncbi:MAG TPA: MBL fold metallo-hydrolase [Nevskiaceae bacterium]